MAQDDVELNKLIAGLGTKVDDIEARVNDNLIQGQKNSSAKPVAAPSSTIQLNTTFGVFVVFVLLCATFAVIVDNNNDINEIREDMEAKAAAADAYEAGSLDTRTSTIFTENYCDGAKPYDAAFDNFDCVSAAADAIEQAGANVTEGYVGTIDNSATPPIISSYLTAGLCPVNVHWHLGAEHLSVGQFDAKGKGPYDDYAKSESSYRRNLAEGAGSAPEERRTASEGGVRLGYQCRHYDKYDSRFTAEYEWEHCVDMMVGQTYEIHWPHSAAGACDTPYQYQTPFYDGVFCNIYNGAPILDGTIGAAGIAQAVGVQSQVFTVVNDEAYYYPDLIKGAIVSGLDQADANVIGTPDGKEHKQINKGNNTGTNFWADVAIYTGSTTGTSRDNDVCSAYSPITWQVDRKCHLISASSFDKMCADMKAQVDDMSGDLHAHGARMLVSDTLASQQYVPARMFSSKMEMDM